MMASERRIDIDDPDVDMDMGQRMLYRGSLFTGEMAEYQDGVLIGLDVYFDGIRDGLSQAWYPDGSLRYEGSIHRGAPLGEFKEWHPNGFLKSRKFFDESNYSIREEFMWNEDGQLLREWHRDA